MAALWAGASLWVLAAWPDAGLPDGFVYVDQVVPDVRAELRYRGPDNFTGRPVAGYEGDRLILSNSATLALARVQAALRPHGLGLLVYDGYRPQQAVDAFADWAADPDDQLNKAAYYPDVDKARLFEEGYISARSGHSRGSTVDLTVVDAATGLPLDMGTRWDHFGPESGLGYAGLSAQQRANRLLLSTSMRAQGFEPYEHEWWHFTLSNEPFPDRYFDFPVR